MGYLLIFQGLGLVPRDLEQKILMKKRWLLLLKLLPSWSLLILLLWAGGLLDGDGDLLPDDLLSGDLLWNGDLNLLSGKRLSGLKCLSWCSLRRILRSSSLPAVSGACSCFLKCCCWTSWRTC